MLSNVAYPTGEDITPHLWVPYIKQLFTRPLRFNQKIYVYGKVIRYGNGIGIRPIKVIYGDE
jgi:hypothetical protein